VSLLAHALEGCCLLAHELALVIAQRVRVLVGGFHVRRQRGAGAPEVVEQRGPWPVFILVCLAFALARFGCVATGAGAARAWRREGARDDVRVAAERFETAFDRLRVFVHKVVLGVVAAR